MPKTIKNSFNNKLTFMNLYKAYLRARMNKPSRAEIFLYEIDLETNLTNLLNNLKKGTYKLGKYRSFTIYEPKKRLIKSLPFVDRIVHQWIVEEFIKPFFVPRFINTNCACIEGRGTHFAVFKVQEYMRKMKVISNDYYILKCDIKKYFYSIDKGILFNIIAKKIKDKKLLKLIEVLIYDDDNDVGIPIGNYTSQYFANIYLGELDNYIKYKLRIKYIVRYMDDFVILVKNKEEAKRYYGLIQQFLRDNLKLELNPKSNYYPSKMGVNFCGYRIFETHRILREKSKKKVKKKIKGWNKEFLKNKMLFNKIVLSWNSWLAHSSHANSYKLQKKLYNRIIFKGFLKNPNSLNKDNIKNFNIGEFIVYDDYNNH